MGLELLHQDVGRDLEEDIWDEEHSERSVILYARQLEVRGQTERLRIGNVDSVKEGEQIEDAKERNHSQVDLR